MLVARADMHGIDTCKNLLRPAFATPEKTAGHVLADGGNREQPEGEGPSRNIVVRFPDPDAARAYFDDPERPAVISSQLRSTGYTAVATGV